MHKIMKGSIVKSWTCYRPRRVTCLEVSHVCPVELWNDVQGGADDE